MSEIEQVKVDAFDMLRKTEHQLSNAQSQLNTLVREVAEVTGTPVTHELFQSGALAHLVKTALEAKKEG